MTPEGKVKDRVKQLLKVYKDRGEGVYAHWPVQTGYGAACLDCHGCYNGLYFAIETKAPGKKPTARQKITLEQVVSSGGVAFVVGERAMQDDGRILYSGMRELEQWLENESVL